MTYYPAQQGSYAPVPARNPSDSVGSWMLALFLTGIPIVGLIYLLVVAFGGSASESRQNWARAQFAWMLIWMVLMIVFLALGGFALFQGAESTSTVNY